MADAASQVKRQLSGDYPASALGWVGDLSWTGPLQVPLSQVDMSGGDPDWAPARANRRKLAAFAARIRSGDLKPVTLVRTPGNGKLRCIDGHTRTLACLSLGRPVPAWVGTARTAHGPWEALHSQQLDMANAPGLTKRSGASNPAAPGSIISLELSALTPVLAVTPAPAGKPGGPGLWRVKGMELPPYFQNIRNALIRDGHSTADAYRITWGAIRRWARGGGNVHPEVRAAARKALADLAAKSAIAHADHANEAEAVELAGAFTESLHPRIGGKFASKGGRPVAAARARHAPKAAAMPGRPVSGTMTRGQQMRYQAAQDRHVARQIMLKIAALVRERDKAIAGLGGGHGAGRISKPVNAARSAAARKAAISRKTGIARKTGTAKAKTVTAATPGRTRVERLDGQIRLLRRDARLLIAAADKLDSQAAGLS